MLDTPRKKARFGWCIRITSYNVCYTKLLRKYQRSRQPAHSVTFEPQAATADGGVPLLNLLLPPAREASPYILCFRGLLLLLLAVWGARLALAGSASNAAGESLLHLVNLPSYNFV